MFFSEWEFLGPFNENEELANEPGVYVLLNTAISEIEVVSIGLAESDISSEIQGLELWRERHKNKLSAFVLYAKDSSNKNLAEVKQRLILEYLS